MTFITPKSNKKLFQSHTARLALLYALIFSASTLILFYFFYLFTASYMSEQMENTIDAEILGLSERYNQDGLPGLSAVINERIRTQSVTNKSIYLLVNTTFNRINRIAGNIDWPRDYQTIDGWMHFRLTSQNNHLARAKIFRLPGGYGLLVGRDVSELTQTKRRIIRALSWGLMIMVMLAVIGGLVLSRRTLRKIERINETAQSIMEGDMSMRIELSKRNDDFDMLSSNLNLMLDRIQQLMEDIRRVSDNIAHDLKTPLARLRQNLDEAKKFVDPESSTALRLEDSTKEADNLLSTFNALLRIARIEAGQASNEFTPVNYYLLLLDVIELYEPLAEDKQQIMQYDLTENLIGPGDQNMLFQVFANLLENAIKYTPTEGTITIKLKAIENDIQITIADNGPGIPVEEHEKVFRRFYRIEASRTTTGNGLGLSLVQAVINMHRGNITLSDNQPGLKNVITLPKLSDSETPESE